MTVNISEIIQQHGTEESALIPILQDLQKQVGYLKREDLETVAQLSQIKLARLFGVVTFYSQFRLKPIGKHLIKVCEGTACHVKGSQRLIAHLSEKLQIISGETTEDGLFTLEGVACLGCCSLAPAMVIDQEVFGQLTPQKIDKLLDQYEKQDEKK